jgi:hypothetical protein
VAAYRRFEALRKERDEAGRKERGRGLADPFVGDPLVEGVSEAADGVNYVYEEMALEKPRLQLWQAQAIEYHFRQAAQLMQWALEDAESGNG